MSDLAETLGPTYAPEKSPSPLRGGVRGGDATGVEPFQENSLLSPHPTPSPSRPTEGDRSRLKPATCTLHGPINEQQKLENGLKWQ